MGTARAALTLLPVLQGIFISRIAEGGAAHRDGILCVGDRVISVSAGRGWPSPLPPSCRGCFSATGAAFWGSFLQLLSLLGECLIWVVLPCLGVGAVTPALSPNALCHEWHGGRGHGSAAQPEVPLEPGGLGHGEGGPLGAQWGGVQQRELPRGAVE